MGNTKFAPMNSRKGKYDLAALWSQKMSGDNAERLWRDAVEFARTFHWKHLNEEKCGGPQNTSLEERGIDRAQLLNK